MTRCSTYQLPVDTGHVFYDMKEIPIITAITGGFDEPKDVPAQNIPVKRHMFTGGLDAGYSLNERTQALYFKQQMHKVIPGHDYYIWIDGKVQVLAHDFAQQCVDALGDNDIAILRHGSRSSVKEEVMYILWQIGKGDRYLTTRYGHRDLASQWQYMDDAGYPDMSGLNDCSIICMRNTDAARQVMDKWWMMCSDGIWFDQIVIKQVAWECGVEISPIDLKPASFKLVKHNVCR